METFELSMLGVMVPQAVNALVLIAVGIAALMMRARLGSTVTALTVAAAAIGTLDFLASAWWQSFGIRSVIMGDGEGRYTLISIVGLVFWLVHLVWTSLLIAAVFVGRRRPPVVENAVMAPGSPL
ncbi:hypothetical protein Cme02nite_40850 [Catellatospora methionotrophica]|uniref:Uncharacterized protein n=1 Tax=Catellatospora methionotrophica TaxID=121620 RepID=A0A8J3PGW1_9ACTN|nr:hypothetical protein [Catellatospora methionotrophica]GIG15753.1 hypothetical protein Cme02nite_40850 [Catellatospora methionotrophica]